jgi:hypothetical protein
MIYITSSTYQDVYYITEKDMFISIHEENLWNLWILTRNDVWMDVRDDDTEYRFKRDAVLENRCVATETIRRYTFCDLENIMLNKILENI